MNGRKNTLSLLSGKGGSGKTVIALSMCKVLSEAGHKVLLVDCDLSTHGATYFFDSELESNEGRALSVVDLLDSADNQKMVLETKMGFDFVPSTANPSEIIDPTHLVSQQAMQNLGQRLGNLCDKYDAVIFDCQAGYSAITAAVVDFSQRNLIVLEPDAVSSASLRVLYLQLGKKLKSNSTWQIFNKLTEEERPIYEKVFGGTLFSNLPPIPFDWQVRAAFATSEIPSTTSKWSAFGLGIIRLMQTLFPAFREDLGNLETRSVGSWHSFLTERIQALEQEKRQVMYGDIETQRRARLRRMRFMAFLTANIGAGVTIVAILAYLRVVSLDKIFTVYSPFLGALAGIIVAIVSLFRYTNSVKEVEAERTQDLRQQSLGEIESELKKYATLVATDPRLKEYERKKVPDLTSPYSCFISYSQEDKEFARLLHDRLQRNGIRAWFDEYAISPGDNIHETVKRAIRLQDKVLLCASKSSLTSWWVDKEIQLAIDKEIKMDKELGQKITVLIPLNIDGYLFGSEYQGKRKQDLTARVAVNFVGWEKDPAIIDRELAKLVRVMTERYEGHEQGLN